jgi:hypothetical protein
MIGTTGKNINPFDSNAFAKLFFDAFGAKVLSYNLNAHNNHQQITNIFGAPVSMIMGHPSFEVRVVCYVDRPEHSSSWMMHFGLPGRRHIVQSVQTTHERHMHQVEITYKTDDLDEFMRDLGNISYQRFSDKFHQDLDNMLEKEDE